MATSSTLVVIRGNSASGKSTIAEEIRTRRDLRDVAIIGQDNVRRIILKEKDGPGTAYIGLLESMTHYAIANGFHVILEGVLTAEWSGDMLLGLLHRYAPNAFCYYLDVPFEETLRRHQTKPVANAFGEPEMRSWYRERDLLGIPGEVVIPASSTLDESVALIGRQTNLLPEAHQPL